jgi:hypothetical protein
MMSDEDIAEYHNIGKESGIKNLVINTTIYEENSSRTPEQGPGFMT